MQKETTIKEKKLYMCRHFVIYHPLILGLYVKVISRQRGGAPSVNKSRAHEVS